VISPLEDTYACAIARQQALTESAKMIVGRMGKRPVRAQSVLKSSETTKRWWLQGERPQGGPKRGLTG